MRDSDEEYAGSVQQGVLEHQIARTNRGYVRHEVVGDGDCGYTAFGITREDAEQLLLNNLQDITDFIKIPVGHSLLTEEFSQYLVEKRVIQDSITHESVIDSGILDEYIASDAIQRAYISYDVHDKRIDAGYSHPGILQALAHIQHIALHMWRLGEDDVLIPHGTLEGNYAKYIPTSVHNRVDLLFVNNNHFEKLDIQGYEDNIPSEGIHPFVSNDFKKRKLSGEARDNHDQECVSDHSSDIHVHAADKQDLIVSVREEFSEEDGSGRMRLLISNLRPNTALGKTQGDHVTAYQCLLEMLMVAVDEQPLRVCAEVIIETAKSILPDKSSQFDRILDMQVSQIERVITPEERHKLVGLKDQQDDEKIRLDYSLKIARRAIFRQIIEQVGEAFIRTVNLDEDTAFTRIGPMDKSQGAHVKIAIHALKAINDFRSIYNDPHCSEKKLNSFYKHYIVTRAPYKDGANTVFGKQEITYLNGVWNTSDKKALLNDIYLRLDMTKIGDFFGSLFDFPYETHKDNLMLANILFKIIAKHRVVMFRAFPEFRSFEPQLKQDIIDRFIRKSVLEEQGWSNFKVLYKGTVTPLDITILNTETSKLIQFDKHRLLSHEERELQNQSSAVEGSTLSFHAFV